MPMQMLPGSCHRSVKEYRHWEIEQISSSSAKNIIHREAQENGAGGIGAGGNIGSLAGDMVSVRAVYEYRRFGYSIGDKSWENGTQTEELLNDAIYVRYTTGGQIPEAQTQQTFAAPPLYFDILPLTSEALIPGSLRFRLGPVNRLYSDRNGTGILYCEEGTYEDNVAGSIDYDSRMVEITLWEGSPNSVSIVSALTTKGQFTIDQADFRTASAPIAPSSLQLLATDKDGSLINVNAAADGAIAGSGIESGKIEVDIGFVTTSFTEPVYPNTVKYNGVAYNYIPLQPDIIGVSPVRLPSDGRVPKIRKGDYAVVYEDAQQTHTPVADTVYDTTIPRLAYAYFKDGVGEETETLPNNLTSGQIVSLNRQSRSGPLEYCVLTDAEDRSVAGELFDADLENWEITFADPLSLDGYSQPLTATYLALLNPLHYSVDAVAGTIAFTSDLDMTGYTTPLDLELRWHDLSLIAEAQTTGLITLQSELTHNYSTAAKISALLLHGDLKARVTNLFEQNTDSGSWSDSLQGDQPTGGGRYDDVAYPVYVTNEGAIRERWRIKRRSDGNWDVIGETLGVIAIWNGASTLEAKRLSSQEHPYFTMQYQGLGAGWSTGNFIQFETYAAQGPFWVLRTVRPGQATVSEDSIRLRHRVGAD
jgi:hypothetical protein